MPQIYVKVGGKDFIIERDTDEQLFESLDEARAKYGDDFEVTGVSEDFARSAPAPVVSDTGTGVLGAGVQGFSQGATFGWGDELSAAVNQAQLGDEPIGLAEGVRERYGQTADEPLSNYQLMRDVIRGGQAAAREESPWAYGIGEFLGAGGATAPLMAGGRAGQVLSRLGPRTLVGAGEGALYGAGLSEAETSAGVTFDADIGAGIGAGLAAVAPPVLRTVGRGLGHAANRIMQEIYETPTQEARRHIQRALARDEVIPEVAEDLAAETGGRGMLADVSPEVTSLAETIAQRPGGGRRFFEEAFEERQAGQQARIANVARREIDPKWSEDYHGMMQTLTKGRKEMARPLYDEAYAKGIRVPKGSGFQSLIKRINDAYPDTFREAEKLMRAEGPQHGGQVELLDYVGRELYDKAFRAGFGTNEARVLMKLKNQLDDELYKAVPELKRARNVYAGSSRMIDAAETGRDMLRGKKYADDVADVVKKYTDSEMDAFRTGVIRGIQDKIRGVNVTHNATRRLLNSTEVRDLLRLAFPNQAAAERFFSRMYGEETMSATQQRVLHGSPTARRQAGEADLSTIGDAVSTATDIKTGGAMVAFRRALNWLTGNKPLTEEGARELAELLTQPATRETVEDYTRHGLLRLPQRTPGDSPGLWRGVSSGALPLLLED